MGAAAGKRSSRRKTRTAPVRATGGRVTVLAEEVGAGHARFPHRMKPRGCTPRPGVQHPLHELRGQGAALTVKSAVDEVNGADVLSKTW